MPQPQGFCPACGRYVGPADACPYCEQEVPDLAARTLLRTLSVLGALVGLAILLFLARRAPVRAYRVSDLTPWMDNAWVQLEGRVTRPPYVGNQAEPYVSFLLDDGSGVVRVQCHDPAAQHLIDTQRFPARGTRLRVTGQIRMDAGETLRLRVQATNHLEELPGHSAAEATP